MAGKVLRCDHDGCDAAFPQAPVRGIYWRIRAEAEKVGWTSSRSGKYSVDDDGDRTILDFCPEHVEDLVETLDLAAIVEKLDRAVTTRLAEELGKRSSSPPPPSEPLTLAKIQTFFVEIKAGPRPPVIERRGTTIYVDGVPTFELNMPMLVGWTRMNVSIPFVAGAAPGMRIAIEAAAEDQIARQLAERSRRITDVGTT